MRAKQLLALSIAFLAGLGVAGYTQQPKPIPKHHSFVSITEGSCTCAFHTDRPGAHDAELIPHRNVLGKHRCLGYCPLFGGDYADVMRVQWRKAGPKQ